MNLFETTLNESQLKQVEEINSRMFALKDKFSEVHHSEYILREIKTKLSLNGVTNNYKFKFVNLSEITLSNNEIEIKLNLKTKDLKTKLEEINGIDLSVSCYEDKSLIYFKSPETLFAKAIQLLDEFERII